MSFPQESAPFNDRIEAFRRGAPVELLFNDESQSAAPTVLLHVGNQGGHHFVALEFDGASRQLYVKSDSAIGFYRPVEGAELEPINHDDSDDVEIGVDAAGWEAAWSDVHGGQYVLSVSEPALTTGYTLLRSPGREFKVLHHYPSSDHLEYRLAEDGLHVSCLVQNISRLHMWQLRDNWHQLAGGIRDISLSLTLAGSLPHNGDMAGLGRCLRQIRQWADRPPLPYERAHDQSVDRVPEYFRQMIGLEVARCSEIYHHLDDPTAAVGSSDLLDAALTLEVLIHELLLFLDTP